MLRLFGAKTPVERERPQAVAVPAVTDFSELEAVFDKLSEGLAEVSSIQALVVGLRQALTQALVQQRALKSQNARLESTIASLQDDLDASRESGTASAKRLAQLETELPQLRQALAGQEELTSDLQNRIVISQTDLRSAVERAQDLAMRLETTQRDLTSAGEDLVRGRDMLVEEQNKHAALQKSFAETRAELDSMIKEARSLTQLAERNAGEISDRDRELAEMRAERTRLQATIESLSSRLDHTLLELESTKKQFEEANRDHAENRRVTEAKLAGVQSRAATLNGLLDDARDQLARRTAELRDALNDVKDVQIAKNRAEARAEAAGRAVTDAVDVQRKTEEARRVLFERTEMLAKALSAKEKNLQRVEMQIGEFEMKLRASEQLVEKNARIHAKREQELLAQLERERMERSLTEGASEVLRRDKLRIQRELVDLKARLTAATLSGEIEEGMEGLVQLEAETQQAARDS